MPYHRTPLNNDELQKKVRTSRVRYLYYTIGKELDRDGIHKKLDDLLDRDIEKFPAYVKALRLTVYEEEL
jgi:hypothetical protein